MIINKENMRNIWIVAVIAAYSLWVTTSDKVYEILNLWEWEKKELLNKMHTDDPNRQVVLVKTTEFRKPQDWNWSYSPNKQFFDTLSLQRLNALDLKQWSQIWLEEYRHFSFSCTEKVNACVHKLLVSLPRSVQYCASLVSAVNLTSVTTPRKAILASAYIVSKVGNGVIHFSAETGPCTKNKAAIIHKKIVFFIVNKQNKIVVYTLYIYIRKNDLHRDKLIQTNNFIVVF
jgi:hypothetical protein